jgi:hypothetical protein
MLTADEHQQQLLAGTFGAATLEAKHLDKCGFRDNFAA